MHTSGSFSHMTKDLGLKSEISSIQTAEVRSLGLNKLTTKTVTSRLAHYQTRLGSNLGVCVTFGPCVCLRARVRVYHLLLTSSE